MAWPYSERGTAVSRQRPKTLVQAGAPPIRVSLFTVFSPASATVKATCSTYALDILVYTGEIIKNTIEKYSYRNLSIVHVDVCSRCASFFKGCLNTKGITINE